MIDLVHLRTFVTVTQESHLSRAAERLHISQPTASQHVRALEEHFGLPLFSRSAKGLTPTVAGLKLYANSLSIIASVMGLDELLNPLKSSLQGNVVIGTVYEPHLIRELARFSEWLLETHPLIQLSIENRNSNSVLNGLANGELDIGFFLGNDHPSGVNAFPIGNLQFQLSFHAKWKTQVERLDWAEMSALPWILMPEDNPVHALTRQFLQGKGIHSPRNFITVNNNALMSHMVRSGVGIGFLKVDETDSALIAQNVHFLSQAQISSKISCGCMASRANHPSIRSLMNACKQLEIRFQT